MHVLYTVNVDGSALTQVTNAPGREEAAPAWSPDGKQLAFLGCYGNNCDLIVRNADGSGGETTLVHGGAGAPDWQALPRNTSTPGSGGASIAAAPELPVGQQHAANRSGGPDYWRATLRRGDEVLVRFAASGTGSVRLCLLPPTITDAGSDNAICTDSGTASAGGTRVVGLIASSSGRWTLAFDACGSCDLVFHPHDWTEVSYAVTLLVRRYTQVTVQAPTRVRAGASFACAGRVAGASGGRIQMELRAGSGWVRIATGPIRSDGGFTLRTRVAGPARRTSIRLSYRGDAGHLPSETTFALRVR